MGRFFVGCGLVVELVVEGAAFSEVKDEGFGRISRSTFRCGFRAEDAIFCCCCCCWLWSGGAEGGWSMVLAVTTTWTESKENVEMCQ